MATIEEVKAKFSSVEKINQSLKRRINFDTERAIKNRAEDSYNKAVNKLLS